MKVLSTERARSLTGSLARHGDSHDATIPGSLGSVSVFIDDVTGTLINGCLIQPYTACPGANLTGADLTGADLTGADLIDALLPRGANLSGMDLRWATWVDGTICGPSSIGDGIP
jgi:hypothetical protein